MKKTFPGNNYCPCGSKLKYKNCCQHKGVDYFIKKGGKLKKEAALTGERRAEFEEDVRLFIAEHGRKPNEEEEGLLRHKHFDEIGSVIQQELEKLGASPEIIYAYKKTGILFSRESEQQINPEELQRWTAAVEEFRRLSSRDKASS